VTKAVNEGRLALSLVLQKKPSGQANMKTITFTVFIFLAAVSNSWAATSSWTMGRDSDLGFHFTYPSDLFRQIGGEGKPSFHYFVSRDSEAKFMVGAWNNEAGQTPNEFKRWLLANTGGYDDKTYVPRGRTWFVISGYRGDDIYYEKVMFSCAGGVVNVFAITYPKDRRRLYDPVVERMEDSFRPSRRCPS
jgi:hypothetical protein